MPYFVLTDGEKYLGENDELVAELDRAKLFRAVLRNGAIVVEPPLLTQDKRPFSDKWSIRGVQLLLTPIGSGGSR